MNTETAYKLIGMMKKLGPLNQYAEEWPNANDPVSVAVYGEHRKIVEALCIAEKDGELLEAFSIHFDIPEQAVRLMNTQLLKEIMDRNVPTGKIDFIQLFFTKLETLRDNSQLHNYALELLLEEGGS